MSEIKFPELNEGLKAYITDVINECESKVKESVETLRQASDEELHDYAALADAFASHFHALIAIVELELKAGATKDGDPVGDPWVGNHHVTRDIINRRDKMYAWSDLVKAGLELRKALRADYQSFLRS